MNPALLETNQRHILDNEQERAGQLARMVLERPVPSIWMILIPVLFVFHVWRIKAYGCGLTDFAEHYLVPRRRALDAAAVSVRTGDKLDFEGLLGQAASLPAPAIPLYREWMALLTEHYRLLLTARGDDYAALVRSGYQHKTTYLLCCNRLNRAEQAFSLALLPQIGGESSDLQDVLARMNHGIADLRRREGDRIFA